MRSRLLEASIFLLVISVAGATIWWRYSLFPAPSAEVVKLDAQKRDLLMRLRREQKFEANDYPPLGYNGPASVADGAVARAAVNDVLDTILARRNGPVSAIEVSNLIDHAMTRVDGLETEDRDRTSGYMVEIWYILGFKGATGHFAYGSGFSRPAGYEEPLPPGWKSPTEPRPIGSS